MKYFELASMERYTLTLNDDAPEELRREIRRCQISKDLFGQNEWAPDLLCRVLRRYRGRNKFTVQMVADPAATA